MKLARVAGTVVIATVLVACGPVKRPDGGEGLLPVGASAPNVEGRTKDGKTLSLTGAGDKVKVVYFYPKDDTPGCTKEACAFRDSFAKYEQAGVVVFGVSKDSQASHDAFAKKHELPFYLTADESGSIDLHRHHAVHRRLERLVDGPHPAFSDLLQDLELAVEDVPPDERILR